MFTVAPVFTLFAACVVTNNNCFVNVSLMSALHFTVPLGPSTGCRGLVSLLVTEAHAVSQCADA